MNDNALTIIDDCILEQAQIASLYGAASPEVRTMKGLFNKETSQLVVMYGCDKCKHITGKDFSNIKDSVPAPS